MSNKIPSPRPVTGLKKFYDENKREIIMDPDMTNGLPRIPSPRPVTGLKKFYDENKREIIMDPDMTNGLPSEHATDTSNHNTSYLASLLKTLKNGVVKILMKIKTCLR